MIEIFWSTRSEKDLNHQHALCVFDSPLFATDNPSVGPLRPPAKGGSQVQLMAQLIKVFSTH